MSNDDRRGAEIRFVGGTHIGHIGWLDNSRDETAHYIPVIVHKYKKRNGAVVDYATKVKRKNVESGEIPIPTSFTQAALQQHPKIGAAIDSICKKLAMCDIDPEDPIIYQVFKEKLTKAAEEQKEKGSNAVWHHVDYTVHS